MLSWLREKLKAAALVERLSMLLGKAPLPPPPPPPPTLFQSYLLLRILYYAGAAAGMLLATLLLYVAVRLFYEWFTAKIGPHPFKFKGPLTAIIGHGLDGSVNMFLNRGKTFCEWQAEFGSTFYTLAPMMGKLLIYHTPGEIPDWCAPPRRDALSSRALAASAPREIAPRHRSRTRVF